MSSNFFFSNNFKWASSRINGGGASSQKPLEKKKYLHCQSSKKDAIVDESLTWYALDGMCMPEHLRTVAPYSVASHLVELVCRVQSNYQSFSPYFYRVDGTNNRSPHNLVVHSNRRPAGWCAEREVRMLKIGRWKYAFYSSNRNELSLWRWICCLIAVREVQMSDDERSPRENINRNQSEK